MKITAAHFHARVGSAPQDDDLERCNCQHSSEIGHSSCGWNYTQGLPVFMVGKDDPVELLTLPEALELSLKVRKDMAIVHDYRFGQGLWNRMPGRLSTIQDELTGGSEDFFHEKDEDKVNELFYKNFVERVDF